MMCQVHTGAYVSHYSHLENRLYRLPPRNNTTYILHVLIVPITTHTHVRLKAIGKNAAKKRKEEKGKKAKNERKEDETRKEKQEKTRQVVSRGSKERKREEALY